MGLSLAAVVAALVTTRHGSALSPDSVAYVSTARNLVDGRGLVDFTGQPLTVFAPAFSVVLAGGELLGIGATSGARLLNAAAHGAMVLLTFWLLRRHVHSRSVLVVATACVALSASLLRVVGTVWSDPLFVVASLCFLLVVDTWTRDVPPIRSVIAASLLVWVAFLVRYVGASLLFAGALTLTWASWRAGWRSVTTRLTVFVGIAVAVPLAWALRNLESGASEPLGLRLPTDEGLGSVAGDLLRAGVHVFAPERLATGLAFVTLTAGALLIGTVAWRCRDRLLPVLRADGRSMVPLVIFVAVYVAVVTVAHKTTGSDLDPRILIPAAIPLVVIGAWFVDRVLLVERGLGARRVVVALIAVSLVGSSVAFVHGVDVGAGTTVYSGASAENVPLARALERVSHTTMLVSNDPWRIYAATNRQPIEVAPFDVRPGASHLPMTNAALRRAACRRKVLLVWFATGPESGRRTIETFEANAPAVELAHRRRFAGGTSARVVPAASCTPEPS